MFILFFGLRVRGSVGRKIVIIRGGCSLSSVFRGEVVFV